ncbi:MAG: DegV family protein [Anaerolineales bacterium]|nr:DegV family protein [Anaerolineales bacterium]
MSKVALVADSTTYLPEEYIAKYSVSVAPCMVIWGEEELRDGIDIKPDAFYERLSTADVMPTTTQPTPADFESIYRELLDAGKDILVVTISHKLSGTYSSAEQAKAVFPDAKIAIIDSLTASLATGWAIIMAARAAEHGASLEECAAVAQKCLEQSNLFFLVDTLEFLHRGGRIGGASRFLGTALNFKPILEVIDGRIEPLERVRTKNKALDRLMDIVAERANGHEAVRIGVLHANNPEGAKDLIANLETRLSPIEAISSGVSPAIGTHVGPGTLGIAIMMGEP